MSTVRFIGIKQFDDFEQTTITTLCTRYMEKLERDLPKEFKLAFHCKLHKKQGKQKYSFHGRVNTPNFLFSSEASDWDLRRTVHKVMKKLERELQHKYKTEGQPQEKLRPKRGRSVKRFTAPQ